MIRKARINDVPKLQALINQFAKTELLLPRSLSDIYECLRDFWVYEERRDIIGCCALHIVWNDLCEIRSFVVKKNRQGKGIGCQLISTAIDEAKGVGCKTIFALTYIPEYFKKYGFRRIRKELLPHKIWAQCIECPKFPDCKEVAVVKQLR